MPTTTAGNDTINGGGLWTDLDGLAGDDLLILNYSGISTYQGYQIYAMSLNCLSPVFSHLYYFNPLGQTINYTTKDFLVGNFEKIDYTGSDFFGADVYAGAANDTLRGGAQGDFLFGDAGANYIYGGAGTDRISIGIDGKADHLYGGDGDDMFYGVGLKDIIDGGAGLDVLQVSLLRASTAFDGDLSVLFNNPNWQNVEKISSLSLTNFDDIFRIDDFLLNLYPGQTAAIELSGGRGEDLLIMDRSGLDAVYLSANPYFSYFWVTSNASHFAAASFERLKFIGSAGNDFVEDTNGNDTISGGGGDDSFYLYQGADIVIGGTGNDHFLNVSANDTIVGGAGIDSLDLNLNDAAAGVRVTTGAVIGNISGVEIFTGRLTSFDDYANLGAASARLDGGLGNDTLVLDYSGSTAGYTEYEFPSDYDSGHVQFFDHRWGVPFDLLILNQWDTFNIKGSEQVDNFETRGGDDTLKGGSGNDLFNAGAGHNVLYGGVGDDFFYGHIGAEDVIYGGDGNDSFIIYGDHDIYDAGDRIYGGTGFDIAGANYMAQTHGVNFGLRGISGEWIGIEAVSDVVLTGFDDVANLGAITGFKVNGSTGDDRINLDYSDAASKITFTGYFSFVDVGNVYGTGGRTYSIDMKSGETVEIDVMNFEHLNLTATNGGDYVVGLNGSDKLFGLLGNDTFDGGLGDDSLYGDGGGDSLIGEAGKDRLYGGSGHDLLDGGDGNDRLYGGEGIFGVADNDTIGGGEGNDLIFGGNGTDWLHGGGGKDVLRGGNGADVLSGGDGADRFVFDLDINRPTGSRDYIYDYTVGEVVSFTDSNLHAEDILVKTVVSGTLISWVNGSILLMDYTGPLTFAFGVDQPL